MEIEVQEFLRKLRMTGESCFLLLACLLLMRISCTCWAESYRVIVARRRLYDSKAGISIYLLFPLGKFCWALRWPAHCSLLEISSWGTTSWEAPQFQTNPVPASGAEYEGIRESREIGVTLDGLFILSKRPKALMSSWCPIFHQAPPQNTTIVFSWRMSLQPLLSLLMQLSSQ